MLRLLQLPHVRYVVHAHHWSKVVSNNCLIMGCFWEYWIFALWIRPQTLNRPSLSMNVFKLSNLLLFFKETLFDNDVISSENSSDCIIFKYLVSAALNSNTESGPIFLHVVLQLIIINRIHVANIRISLINRRKFVYWMWVLSLLLYSTSFVLCLYYTHWCLLSKETQNFRKSGPSHHNLKWFNSSWSTIDWRWYLFPTFYMFKWLYFRNSMSYVSFPFQRWLFNPSQYNFWIWPSVNISRIYF